MLPNFQKTYLRLRFRHTGVAKSASEDKKNMESLPKYCKESLIVEYNGNFAAGDIIITWGDVIK